MAQTYKLWDEEIREDLTFRNISRPGSNLPFGLMTKGEGDNVDLFAIEIPGQITVNSFEELFGTASIIYTSFDLDSKQIQLYQYPDLDMILYRVENSENFTGFFYGEIPEINELNDYLYQWQVFTYCGE